MAGVCEVCGKGQVSGFQYSHSHIRTKRKWLPNLHRVRAVINGSPARIYVCTRCLRTGKVARA